MSWIVEGSIEVETVAGADPQKTIARPAEFRGVALHSGQDAAFVAEPAPAGYGIRFGLERFDGTAPAQNFAYSHDNTTSVQLAGVQIRCVEHLLSALHGLGIANLHMRCLHGDEFPIFDGSAGTICALLDAAGIVEQKAAREAVRIVSPFTLTDESGVRRIACTPASRLEIQADIDFPAPIGRQSCRFECSPGAYREQIAGARTFLQTPLEQVSLEALRAGRLKGLEDPCQIISYENGEFLCPLRWADEPVRHKIVDFLGDIYTIGATFEGAFHLVRPGHELTRKFIELVETALERETVERPAQPPGM